MRNASVGMVATLAVALSTLAAGCGGIVMFDPDGAGGSGGSGSGAADTSVGAGPQVGGGPTTTGPQCELLSETRGASVAANLNLVGNVSWDNPEAVTEFGSGFAEIAGMSEGDTSRYLIAQDFGFALPPTATVFGVEVRWTREGLSGAGLEDNEVRLLKFGDPAGENRAAFGQTWGAFSLEVPYGGADDLWGEPWSAADVNDPSFGAALSVFYNFFAGNDWARATDVSITVYFTEC